MTGVAPLLPTSSIVDKVHWQNPCSTLTHGPTTKRAPLLLLSSHCASSTTSRYHPLHHPNQSLLSSPFSFPLNFFWPCRLAKHRLYNLNPSSSLLPLVLTKNFGKTTTVKSDLTSTIQANHHPFLDEIDNMSIIYVSLRQEKPDGAFRFLGLLKLHLTKSIHVRFLRLSYLFNRFLKLPYFF